MGKSKKETERENTIRVNMFIFHMIVDIKKDTKLKTVLPQLDKRAQVQNLWRKTMFGDFETDKEEKQFMDDMVRAFNNKVHVNIEDKVLVSVASLKNGPAAFAKCLASSRGIPKSRDRDYGKNQEYYDQVYGELEVVINDALRDPSTRTNNMQKMIVFIEKAMNFEGADLIYKLDEFLAAYKKYGKEKIIQLNLDRWQIIDELCEAAEDLKALKRLKN